MGNYYFIYLIKPIAFIIKFKNNNFLKNDYFKYSY